MNNKYDNIINPAVCYMMAVKRVTIAEFYTMEEKKNVLFLVLQYTR